MTEEILEVIKEVDREDMLSLIRNFPKHCQETVAKVEEKTLPTFTLSQVDNIVITGQGGSAISGDIFRSYTSLFSNLPVFVNRCYNLPSFISARSVVVPISYSGNTEETLKAFREAIQKTEKILCIASGGKLQEEAEKRNLPVINIPKGMPPRAALGYLFFSLLLGVKKLGLIKVERTALDECLKKLEELRVKFGIDSPPEVNLAKRVAKALHGKIPLIYASERLMAPVALRWKTQLNENSKVPCYYALFSELNHNEIMGWEAEEDLTEKFYVIFIKDKDDGVRIRLRMKLTREIIQGKAAGSEEIETEGQGILTRLLSVIYLGDWVSFYLALLRRVNPTRIKSIEFLKAELGKIPFK